MNNVKDNQHNHGDDDLYTNKYEPGDVAFGWSVEYIQSGQSITVGTVGLVELNKWFSAHNQYMDGCHVKWINKFGHNVDEEDNDISGDEQSKEDYEKEEERKQERKSKKEEEEEQNQSPLKKRLRKIMMRGC